jgi:hypothetical protein
MSFMPGPAEPMEEELLRSRERELELKAEQYSRLHPETDYPVRKRPHRLLHRLAAVLERRRVK